MRGGDPGGDTLGVRLGDACDSDSAVRGGNDVLPDTSLILPCVDEGFDKNLRVVLADREGLML